jgi:hypothetical protein
MDKKTSENMIKILESGCARKPLFTDDVEKWAVKELTNVNEQKYNQLNEVGRMFLLSHFITLTKHFTKEMVGTSAENEAANAWDKILSFKSFQDLVIQEI